MAGSTRANPRFFKKHRESVERAQKHLEATSKDSPQRRAAKIAVATALELLEGREKDAFGTDAPLQVRLRADARSERRASQFAVGAEQPWPGTGPKRHAVPACGLGGVVHGPSITRTKFCGWMYAAKAL